jgi:hypothetical protein
MTPALIPCPFCGESIDDVDFARGASGSMAVECSYCQAVGPFVIRGRAPAIHEPVIAAWNTRAPARVKPLAWREIDPGHRFIGTGLGFTCEVHRLHKGGWEAIWPLSTAEFPEKAAALQASQDTYAAMVRSYLDLG